MKWYLEVLKKYAVFGGRARRTEYWMFILFNMIVEFLLGLIEAVIGLAPEMSLSVLCTIYGLAIWVPSLAVSVRRLHDIGKSGWWLLIGLIPLVGQIVMLIFLVTDSNTGDNQYGSNPKTT